MSRSESPISRRERSASPRGGGDRHSRSNRSRSGDRGNSGKRIKGTAARWNDKGFGFIKRDDGEDDVFCHYSGIKDGNMLREGSIVEFEVRYDETKGKDRAEEVTGGAYEDRNRDRGGGGRFNGECYDFKQNRCDRGSSCKFSHGNSGGDRYGGDRRGGDRYESRGRDRYDDRRSGGYDDRRGSDRDDDRRRGRERY